MNDMNSPQGPMRFFGYPMAPTLGAIVGVVLFCIGIGMTALISSGYGQSRCGTWGIDCALRALAWHFGAQGVATSVLWWAASKASPGSVQKKLQIALAVCATLFLAFPAIVIGYVLLLS